VGAQRRGFRIEITTYRAEAYDRSSRNPVVSYGSSLVDDLARRDFAVNAMAVALPDWKAPDAFVDPYGGMDDLAGGVLRTPGGRRTPSATTRCGCCAPPASPPSSASRWRRRWSRR
jgi:poly(A) polymerase